MSTLLDLAFFVVGLVLLVKSADWLIHGAGTIARRLGVSPLVVGLTVVAFGTSAPELAASVGAVLKGAPDIPIGNVVGSNIANVGLILGLVAMVRPFPVESRVVRSDVFIMVGVTAIGAWALRDAAVTRVEAGTLAGLLVAYVWWTYKASKGSSDGFAAEVVREAEAEFGIGDATPITRPLVQTILGIVGLAGGSWLLVQGAVGVAEALGVPEYVIAVVMLAVGTSIPELAATFQAVRKREPDLAVGNILGSNVFNLLCVLGISGLVGPLLGPSEEVRRDLWVMGAFAVACIPMLAIGRRLTRAEGGLLFLGYLAYIAVVALHRGTPA